MMEKIEFGRDLIILDAGDFTGRANHRQKMVAELFFKVFGRIKYTGILPGEQELSLGISELKKLSIEHDVPIICNNVVDKLSGDLIFNKYIIKSLKRKSVFKKKLRVGITGIIDSAFIHGLPSATKDKIDIVSPFETLKEIIPVLKEDTDIIILLAHTAYSRTAKISQMFPEINIILTAHGKTYLQGKNNAPGKTIFLDDVKKGKELSWLQIFFDKKRRIANFEENSVSLGLELPEDPEIKELIKSLGKQNRTDIRQTSITKSFVTASNCRNCHLKEFKQWVKTPHARAFDTLVAKDKQNEWECLKCHVTGAGFNKGFGDLKSTPEFINVQCEACHGPGSFHSNKPEKGYGKISPLTCKRCHDEKNDPEFDFEKKYKLVIHRQ